MGNFKIGPNFCLRLVRLSISLQSSTALMNSSLSVHYIRREKEEMHSDRSYLYFVTYVECHEINESNFDS